MGIRAFWALWPSIHGMKAISERYCAMYMRPAPSKSSSSPPVFFDDRIEHRLRDCFPHFRFLLWKEFVYPGCNCKPYRRLGHEFGDSRELDLAALCFDAVERLGTGDLHNTVNTDA